MTDASLVATGVILFLLFCGFMAGLMFKDAIASQREQDQKICFRNNLNYMLTTSGESLCVDDLGVRWNIVKANNKVLLIREGAVIKNG